MKNTKNKVSDYFNNIGKNNKDLDYVVIEFKDEPTYIFYYIYFNKNSLKYTFYYNNHFNISFIQKYNDKKRYFDKILETKNYKEFIDKINEIINQNL